MTSSVLSALLTASVLACRGKLLRNVIEAQPDVCYIKNPKRSRRRTERRRGVHVALTAEKTKRGKRRDLTYAQFPTSLAKIFRGTVLGSSLSFPSRIPLKRRKGARLRIKTRRPSVHPMFSPEGHLGGQQPVRYLLMSSNHLSLCSSELRKSDEAQSVAVRVKASLCLLSYATRVCSFGARAIISSSLTVPGQNGFYEQEPQSRFKGSGILQLCVKFPVL